MKTKNLSLKEFAQLYDKQGRQLTIKRFGDLGIAYCKLDRYPDQRHNGFACTTPLMYKTLLNWSQSR